MVLGMGLIPWFPPPLAWGKLDGFPIRRPAPVIHLHQAAVVGQKLNLYDYETLELILFFLQTNRIFKIL